MKETENSVAEIEDDGFEVLPSKPLTDEDRSEIFRTASFKCPVCGMTGGPTFSGNAWETSLMAYGLRIPSDHYPECLNKAAEAYSYVIGRMSEEQMAKYIHTADADCSHPQCVAKRLWGKS